MELTLKFLVCFLFPVLPVSSGDLDGPGVVMVTAEGSDVILPCSLSSKENIEFKLFDWRKVLLQKKEEVFMYNEGRHYNNGLKGQDDQFRGRVKHFPDQLKSGNASILIQDTKTSDSGNYTCAFPHLQPEQIFHITLVVEHTIRDRSGEIPGAAAKPSITTVYQTENWALLQCEVRGASYKPELHWRNRAGNILHAEEPQETERGGSYDIILNITVNNTDYYQCVVTQEEINHQTDAMTHVFISEKLCEDTSRKEITGWLGGWVLGVLALAAVQLVLVAAKCITIKGFPQRNRSHDADKLNQMMDVKVTDPIPLQSKAEDPAAQCMMDTAG